MAAYAIPRLRPDSRPPNFADLLLLPVNDDPDNDSAFSPGWSEDHGGYRRFYVAGTSWLQNVSGLNANRISQYREEGVARLSEMTENGAINWRAIPGMQSDFQKFWKDISRQQFNSAFNGSPMFLSKALYVLITCEIAIERAIAAGERLPNILEPKITAPTDIYKVMGIIPACWFVTSFTPENLEAAKSKDPDFEIKLARHCGHGADTAFVGELAAGATVQFKTAKAVAEFCGSYKMFGANVGVRAHRLKKLGSKSAASSEGVDRG